MRSIFFLLACTCIITVACKKNRENPQPPTVSGKTVSVKVKLTGDIISSESSLPYGRRVNDGITGAKTLRDSTLYAVTVHTGNYYTVSTGLFSKPDSIYINVPTEGYFNVSVTAYKKGTSQGLFYTFQNGLPYYEDPINTALKNRMDTISGYPYMEDSLTYIRVVDPLDTTKHLPIAYHSEIDSYQGTTPTAQGSANPAPISINLKRRSFGMQFSATDFTSGKLIIEFPYGPNHLLPQTITPATIDQYRIITAEEFKWRDDTFPIPVKVTWEKPDGTKVPIGQKDISFKRNVLTKIQVAIPNTGRTSLGVQVTETDWSGNETVNL